MGGCEFAFGRRPRWGPRNIREGVHDRTAARPTGRAAQQPLPATVHGVCTLGYSQPLHGRSARIVTGILHHLGVGHGVTTVVPSQVVEAPVARTTALLRRADPRPTLRRNPDVRRASHSVAQGSSRLGKAAGSGPTRRGRDIPQGVGRGSTPPGATIEAGQSA